MGWLRPDGKSQVTVEYAPDGSVLRCPAIVVSTQHSPDISIDDLREAVVETVVKPVIPTQYIFIVKLAGTLSVHQHAHRMADADGVGQLNMAAADQSPTLGMRPTTA